MPSEELKGIQNGRAISHDKAALQGEEVSSTFPRKNQHTELEISPQVECMLCIQVTWVWSPATPGPPGIAWRLTSGHRTRNSSKYFWVAAKQKKNFIILSIYHQIWSSKSRVYADPPGGSCFFWFLLLWSWQSKREEVVSALGWESKTSILIKSLPEPQTFLGGLGRWGSNQGRLCTRQTLYQPAILTFWPIFSFFFSSFLLSSWFCREVKIRRALVPEEELTRKIQDSTCWTCYTFCTHATLGQVWVWQGDGQTRWEECGPLKPGCVHINLDLHLTLL